MASASRSAMFPSRNSAVPSKAWNAVGSSGGGTCGELADEPELSLGDDRESELESAVQSRKGYKRSCVGVMKS